MISGIHQWAARHGISPLALNELRLLLGVDYSGANVIGEGYSESRAQSLIRLEAPRFGVRLWRNNVGVLKREDGVPIRFGLANDTKKLNGEIKSGDLIGWQRILITAAMVGTFIARFVSRECKPSDWIPNPNDPHEAAQMRWAGLITADGGDARFAQGEGTFTR